MNYGSTLKLEKKEMERLEHDFDFKELLPDLKYLSLKDLIRFIIYPIKKFHHNCRIKKRIKALFTLENTLIPLDIKKYIVMKYI